MKSRGDWLKLLNLLTDIDGLGWQREGSSTGTVKHCISECVDGDSSLPWCFRGDAKKDDVTSWNAIPDLIFLFLFFSILRVGLYFYMFYWSRL